MVPPTCLVRHEQLCARAPTLVCRSDACRCCAPGYPRRCEAADSRELCFTRLERTTAASPTWRATPRMSRRRVRIVPPWLAPTIVVEASCAELARIMRPIPFIPSLTNNRRSVLRSARRPRNDCPPSRRLPIMKSYRSRVLRPVASPGCASKRACPLLAVGMRNRYKTRVSGFLSRCPYSRTFHANEWEISPASIACRMWLP